MRKENVQDKVRLDVSTFIVKYQIEGVSKTLQMETLSCNSKTLRASLKKIFPEHKIISIKEKNDKTNRAEQ